MSKHKIFSLVAVAAIVGSVAAPVVASAATTATTTVTANVGGVLSITSSGTVAITVSPDADGNVGTADDTITVQSNDPQGYDVTVSSTDATNAMTGDTGGSLPATTDGATLGLNTWGYSLDAGASYNGMPVLAGPADNIRTTAAPSVGGGDVFNVRYGVNVDYSVPTGIYSEAVIYTVTAK